MTWVAAHHTNLSAKVPGFGGGLALGTLDHDWPEITSIDTAEIRE
jgi:hypothetical protein